MPKEELPPAAAVVNPRLPSSSYPFPDICGCMLAYKLAAALQNRLNENENPDFIFDEENSCQLAALGTIADIMPLRDENRIIVRKGLSILNKIREKELQNSFLF
jgi:single-stranded-DNA-specific exonuclease